MCWRSASSAWSLEVCQDGLSLKELQSINNWSLQSALGSSDQRLGTHRADIRWEYPIFLRMAKKPEMGWRKLLAAPKSYWLWNQINEFELIELQELPAHRLLSKGNVIHPPFTLTELMTWQYVMLVKVKDRKMGNYHNLKYVQTQ